MDGSTDSRWGGSARSADRQAGSFDRDGRGPAFPPFSPRLALEYAIFSHETEL